MARDNRTLGRFHLVGLPPAPRGLPQIEVSFDIDANGIVNVVAKDKATGKEQTITISGSSGLSKDEVDRMVKDAEANAAGDTTRREAIDARNQADALIYSVEKTFTENKAKLGAAESGRIESAIEAAKQAVKSDDATAIRNATSELQQASHAMAEALYQANQGSSDGSRAPQDHSPDVKDGEVVDAEYAETR
jgi:molecular chaperone DnaK